MNGEQVLTSQVIETIEKQLRYFASVIREHGREVLKDEELTPPQFVALQWLSDKEGMTIGELSSKMYLAFSTTTDLIDRMESKHLVKRTRDEQDKRMVRIHLLKKGETIIQQVIAKRQEYMQERLDDLSASELDGLQLGLSRLFEMVKEEI